MVKGAKVVEELLRQHVVTAWTLDRAEQVRRAVALRLHRRRRRQRTLGALGAALILLAGTWVSLRNNDGRSDNPVVTEIWPASTMVIAAGSTATALEAGVDVRQLVQRADSPFDWRLPAGAARFTITGNKDVFRIQTTAMTVQVLAAVFELKVVEGQTQLSVQEGEVSAIWPGGQEVLSAGKSLILPALEAAHPAPAPSAPPLRKQSKSPVRPMQSQNRDWQRLVKRGKFDEAFVALEQAVASEGSDAVPDQPSSLLLAADAARLSGHPEQALPHLQRFVRRFPHDPRASLAAFTMGLVLLEELGRPREAAMAFAQSRRFSTTTDLQEDALAREAEAAFRAGDQERAQQAAQMYLQGYPNGRRVGAVKRYGAIE